jgi:hypothetical protein
MKIINSPQTQRGVTLVIALILLTVTTIVVITNFQTTQTDLIAVGNTQFQEEAITAVNIVAEKLVSSPMSAVRTAGSSNVDLNNDGNLDYQVDFDAPVCLKGRRVDNHPKGSGSSTVLGNINLPPSYIVTWDIATRTNDAKSGAKAEVHIGIRQEIDRTQYGVLCPKI